MTNEELKKLEDDLWDAANTLRANSGLKSSEYATPVLGLIFLKFASDKFNKAEPEIKKEIRAQKKSRKRRTDSEIALEKCGFYLPESAKYDYLVNLSGEEDIHKALKKAMETIGEHKKELKGILPQDEYDKLDKETLSGLLKKFSNIPKDASGDVFGKIYEYFLGKFAKSEGQKGGEFFTPTSVVRLMVEVIEPYKGTIYDPACGSGGMFVQSAKFVERRKKELEGKSGNSLKDLFVYGQEKTLETVKLAKMNIAVNGLRGKIKTSNTYRQSAKDVFERKSDDKFDYVMANPPFNVKDVPKETVENDKRFNTYGLPASKTQKSDEDEENNKKSKTKKSGGKTNKKSKTKKSGKPKKNTIPNANYLWINLFATSLNKKGRAALVMANSASDARHSEYDIRKKLIDEGIVDVMISLSSNIFYTVTLPATLWFFDKNKKQKDKVLFIDARDIYQQVDRAHREFTEEQIRNVATIVRLYRGEDKRLTELVHDYFEQSNEWAVKCNTQIREADKAFAELINGVVSWHKSVKGKFDKKRREKAKAYGFEEKFSEVKSVVSKSQRTVKSSEKAFKTTVKAYKAYSKKLNNDKVTAANVLQHKFCSAFSKHIEHFKGIADQYEADLKGVEDIVRFAEKNLKLKGEKDWNKNKISLKLKDAGEQVDKLLEYVQKQNYFYEQVQWLQARFPKARYNDVTGLCKLADKAEIEEQDYSLNPGRYVGIDIEKDDMSEGEFRDEIKSLNNELINLNKRALELEKIISKNIKAAL
ncbi:class I SAM-dependent DNA methyltransferase [Desulfobacterales bacterium HSG2]|nr:class I SAM-dependent DNA methyltransferase [Desulfobacterales bacterium HSG2]